MESLKGNFLISGSTLKEESFNETVVFIIEHNEEGAFGLIVNRKLDSNVSEVLPRLGKKAADKPLYEGGPVRKEVMFVLFSGHTGKYDGEEVIPGVLLGNSYELIVELLEQEAAFHIYSGYAGWAPGQLESELEAKTWVVMPAKREIIFHENPHHVWREALLYGGGLYSYFARHVKDPFLN